MRTAWMRLSNRDYPGARLGGEGWGQQRPRTQSWSGNELAVGCTAEPRAAHMPW